MKYATKCRVSFSFFPKGGGGTNDVAWIIKVTKNNLCTHLFIIIFIDVYHKSEYIPTVTNFVSILANTFYFLWKITALRPSVLNF